MKEQNSHRQYNLYEIYHKMLMMLSDCERSELNLNDVADYCRAVNNNNRGIFNTVIDSDRAIDLATFFETFSNGSTCPVIHYNGKRHHNDSAKILNKLKKFLHTNNLTGKNLITFNFPADDNEFLKCKAAGFSPDNVIKIIPKARLGKIETVERIDSHFESNVTHLNLVDDVTENCNRLKNVIDQSTHTFSLNRDSGFHLQRIILLGQIGSGRKTQSRLLAKRWGLIFLDFRILLLEYAKFNKSFDEHLTKVSSVHKLDRKLVASILFKRITKRDCLENGWILVGYVSSAVDFEIMEKQFFIIPNKILFIHCRQHLCLDRLRARVIKYAQINENRHSSDDRKYAKLGFLDLYSPCYAINHIVSEIDHFCRNRREILKYCQDRAKYIAHVDGEHSVSTVTTMLSGQLEKFHF